MAFVIIFIIGTYIFMDATSYSQLVVGRLLQGMGVILCSYALPVYMTEIAPKDKRGRYVTLFQLNWTLGMCLSGAAVFSFYNYLSWYEYYYVTILFAATIGFLALLLPASPTFLVIRNKLDKCFDIVKKTQPNLSDEEIHQHILEIKESLAKSCSQNIIQKIFILKNIKIILLISSILILNQLTGINAILFTSTKILGTITENIIFLKGINFLIVIVNFLATVLTIIVIDKWGRKKVFFIGLGVGMASLLMLVIIFSLPSFHMKFFLAALFLSTCIGGLAFGPSGIIVTLINELLPNSIRVVGIFVAGGLSTIFAFYFIDSFLVMSLFIKLCK
jgi:MFS family permease